MNTNNSEQKKYGAAIKACPACLHNHNVFDEHLDLHVCRICHHKWNGRSICSAAYYSELSDRNNVLTESTTKKISERANYLEKWLAQKESMRVLEIGCAEGLLGERLKKRGRISYDGIELSKDALKAKARLDNVYNFESKFLDSDPYDLVLSFHVLEHIYDIKEEIGEWKRLLKNDGVLIAEVPNKSGHPLLVIDRNIEHVHQFSILSIVFAFELNGFEVQEITTKKFESVMYTDSIRIVLRKGVDDKAKYERIVNNFNAISRDFPLLIWGIGGDFETYVRPYLEKINVKYLVDGNKSKNGLEINGLVIEDFDISKHSNTNIIIASNSNQNQILAKLCELSFDRSRIHTLADIYNDNFDKG